MVEKSHRPHHHLNEHTPEEKQMILRRYSRYKDDMMLLWNSLRKSGYKRSYASLIRVVRKWIQPEIKRRATHQIKSYARAEYPGQKVQVDVKYVSSYCVLNGRKYYQYTAVDECTRWTYRELYDEHSTYSSACFLANLVKNCPFPIREIQTDNGAEFTNALSAKKNADIRVCLKIYYVNVELSITGYALQHRGTMVRWNVNIALMKLDFTKKCV